MNADAKETWTSWLIRGFSIGLMVGVALLAGARLARSETPDPPPVRAEGTVAVLSPRTATPPGRRFTTREAGIYSVSIYGGAWGRGDYTLRLEPYSDDRSIQIYPECRVSGPFYGQPGWMAVADWVRRTRSPRVRYTEDAERYGMVVEAHFYDGGTPSQPSSNSTPPIALTGTTTATTLVYRTAAPGVAVQSPFVGVESYTTPPTTVLPVADYSGTRVRDAQVYQVTPTLVRPVVRFGLTSLAGCSGFG